MQTLDDAIMDLLNKGMISPEDAYSRCHRQDKFRPLLKNPPEEWDMTKAELDYILGTMLDSHKNVSDLNFTVEKPLQVEAWRTDSVAYRTADRKADPVSNRNDRAGTS